jgi:hypothetical protein
MVQFWLDNFIDLFSLENFDFLSKKEGSNNYIKVLNLVALVSIILGISISIKTKKPLYFGITIIILSITILIRTNIENFSPIDITSNTYNTNIKLTRPLSTNNYFKDRLYVNQAFNINKGDIISIENDEIANETHVVAGITNTSISNESVILLLNDIKNNFPISNTKIYKVSDSTPNIVSPPDGNRSIEDARNNLTPPEYRKRTLPDGSAYDWNLENSTLVAGSKPTYVYQGPEYGDLPRKFPTIQNPMGVIEIPDYDSPPTFYGTINVGDFTDGVSNDKIMTDNQEATISMRVQDLLFHKGNSQWHYTPMPVDTLPDTQEAFAEFCYRSPTNLVNPKYASIFVNDPEKFKLVTKLAKATGTENGGG